MLVSLQAYFTRHSRNLTTSIRVVLIRLNRSNVQSKNESVFKTDIQHDTRIGETEGCVVVGERKGIAFLNERGKRSCFLFIEERTLQRAAKCSRRALINGDSPGKRNSDR